MKAFKTIAIFVTLVLAGLASVGCRIVDLISYEAQVRIEPADLPDYTEGTPLPTTVEEGAMAIMAGFALMGAGVEALMEQEEFTDLFDKSPSVRSFFAKTITVELVEGDHEPDGTIDVSVKDEVIDFTEVWEDPDGTGTMTVNEITADGKLATVLNDDDDPVSASLSFNLAADLELTDVKPDGVNGIDRGFMAALAWTERSIDVGFGYDDGGDLETLSISYDINARLKGAFTASVEPGAEILGQQAYGGKIFIEFSFRQREDNYVVDLAELFEGAEALEEPTYPEMTLQLDVYDNDNVLSFSHAYTAEELVEHMAEIFGF